MDHSRSSSPGALPVSLTPLIGREREIHEVIALIQRNDVRLVTLTGPGGVGKTRLAIASAAIAMDHFPDGTWFVDLAPIADPTLVLLAIARTFGLRDVNELNANEWITSFLGDKRVLLILDNVEQIITAALDIARLPAESAGLTVMVTSRVLLRVTGEYQYPVLPLIGPGQSGASSSISESPAVQLFFQRAQAIQPAMEVNAQSISDVSGICRHLDGLPLAIELAAARVSMFPPSGILRRLQEHLPVLTEGVRDLPERQQTMHNTISWSYNLLGVDEQALLRRLAIFAGGFTLDAAESVGSVEPCVPDVFGAMTHLIDQSLVHRLESISDGPRFGMLQTVRDFGLERLTEAGEHQSAMTALVSWATTFQEQVARGLRDFPQQARWRTVMDAELDNVRSAVNWMLETAQHAEVLRLVGSLEEYWTQRPFYLEVLSWLETSLAAETTVDPIVRAQAFYLASLQAGWGGQSRKAIELSEQGIKIGRETNNPFFAACGLLACGVAWESQEDPVQALSSFLEALPLFEAEGETIWLAITLSEIADKYVLLGSIDEAMPLFERALQIHRRVGYTLGVAMVQSEQANAVLAQGKPFDAARIFSESFRLGQEDNDPRLQIGSAAGLAGVLSAIGQVRLAAVMFGAVESARIANGVVRMFHSLHIQPILERTRSLLGETSFLAAFEEGRTLPLQQAVDDLLAVIQNAETQTVSPDLTDPNGLTPRETDVLGLLVEGKSDREIADALFIGSRTVQTHVSNLLAKLEVSNRAEAAAVAVRKGLV